MNRTAFSLCFLLQFFHARGEESESDLTFHKLLSSVPKPARFSASSKSTPETHAESANSKFTEASVTPLPMITAFSDGTTTLVTCLEQDVNGITSYIRGSSNFQSYFEGTVWTYGEVVSGDIDMFGFDDQGFPAYFVGNVYINGSFSGYYRPAGAGTALGGISTQFKLPKCHSDLNTCLGLSGDNALTAKQVAANYCFWVPDSASSYPAGVYTEFVKPNPKLTATPSFPSFFYPSGFGPNSTAGTIFGAYGYNYDPSVCMDGTGHPIPKCTTRETGYYSQDSITAYGKSATIMATTWHAETGPYKGNFGSSIYAFANNILIGVSCNAVPGPNGRVQLNGCYTEKYTLYPSDTPLEQSQVDGWVRKLVLAIPTSILSFVGELYDAIKKLKGKKN